jgi:DmsE family decaheme c-type cytochrome
MKALRKVIALWLLLGGAWSLSSALAADLPDLGSTPQEQSKSRMTAAESMSKDAVCTKCHDASEIKPVLAIYQTKHGVKGDSRTPSCQSCHGDSEDHVKNTAGKATRNMPDVVFGTKRGSSGAYAPSETKAQNAACLSCHNKDLKRTHWAGGAHQVGDVACASCHELHTAHDKVRDKQTQPEVCFACHKEQRADSIKFSHHPIGEGKVVCSDCHNPHGSAGPKLLKKNTVTETCYSCHAEKRGPFLWEHQPATEDCTTCHTPHGSNITPLLKSRPPFLCDECHNGPHNSTVPYGRGAAVGRPGAEFVQPDTPATHDAGFGDRSAAGRACMNCHSMVHGSNSPSGAFLHR